MAQVAVFPGPCTSDVAGTSETTGWRVGYTILLGPAMAAPAFLQGTQPCALSKLPLPPLVTGGSGGDIPVAADFLLQCHLPVRGDRKPGAVSE